MFQGKEGKGIFYNRKICRSTLTFKTLELMIFLQLCSENTEQNLQGRGYVPQAISTVRSLPAAIDALDGVYLY